MSEIKILSVEESQELDRKTIQGHHVRGQELMKRAGELVASHVADICIKKKFSKEILILCGKGNNGGDAYVAAYNLYEKGFVPRVILTCPSSEITRDAGIHYEKMFALPIDIREIKEPSQFGEILLSFTGNILIDGLLGTGFKPPIKEFYGALIDLVNEQKLFVVSIDIPSGMHGNEELQDHDKAIRADKTLTIGSVKPSLLKRKNINHCGQIMALDIGFPPSLIQSFHSPFSVFTLHDLKAALPKRKRNSHKGDFGHVLIIGGEKDFLGALVLAGLGSVKSGAGLVTLCPLQKESCAFLHVKLTEAMTLDPSVLLNTSAKVIDGILQKFDAIGIGPGLGTSEEALQLLKIILRTGLLSPVVLDADALNLLAGKKIEPEKNNKRPLIMTPHPGEAARLLSTNVDEIENDRMSSILKLNKQWNATIVLKGSHTLVSDSAFCHLHLTGTPAMASGGMGDVLTGQIAGYLAQGFSPVQSCDLGVALAGLSAQDLEDQYGPFGFTATQMAENIPSTAKNLEKIEKKSYWI
ncbi:MAG: NAD(P)H-hydrate dehydratase [Candidatus Aureabacteria bacterium]|nr:NAD(P)H-hydrate dehydratase [Candidatus Auribacterota bacterium]